MMGLKEVMEVERPRVSISASGPYVYARTLSRLSSAGAVPIRAPLTIDDDDETNEGDGSGSESDVQDSASSDASSYSKGMDSGTDEESESGSSDPDDETAEEDADFGGIEVHGPIREDPDAETGESSGFSGRSRVSTSFVGERNQGISVNYSSLGEEESARSSEVDGVSESEIGSETKGVSLKARIVVPRARLSLDDEEVDEILSSEDEDNQLRVAKVPDYLGEKVRDGPLKSGEKGVIDESNCSGSTTGEFISVEEEMVEMNSSDNGSISFETIEEKSGDVVPEESDELPVESEGNSVEAGKGTDETFNQLIEREAIEGSIIGETGHVIDSGTGDTDILMITDCGIVSGLGRQECEAESEFPTQKSESFRMTGAQVSANMENYDVVGAEDVSPSDSGTTDPKVEAESEMEEKQDSEEIERKLSSLDESVGSNFGSSIETADDTADNGELSSPQINNRVSLESGNEKNIVVKVEEGSLLSDKDSEIIASGDCSVITDEEMDIETQIEHLIRDQALKEFDEFAETIGRREKPWHSTVLNVSEESYPLEYISWRKGKEVKERIEKMRVLKTKLLRIIRRLRLSANDSVVTEVLWKLTLASGEQQSSEGFYSDSDIMKTMQLEAEDRNDMDFSINVVVLGKTGVGKSATINSLFGETKSPVGAFGLTTTSAKYIVGKVGGVQIRVLDTPGLRSSATEERVNREVLLSIKKHMRTFPVDVVLYVDRLDEHSGNAGDIQLLRAITGCLGSSIWQNAIVVLTHAASTVPDSSNYNDFVAQRSFLLHQSIRQAVPELGSVHASMMPRVVLAENKEKFPETETGEFASLIWRSQLLLLCCSAKIMAETSYSQENETLMEKSDLFGSPLQSLSRFCSLWNMLLHGADPRQVSCLHDDLERKIGHFLDSQQEDELSKAHLELQTFHMNKKPDDEEKRLENGEISKRFEDRAALTPVRTRGRRRLELKVKPVSEGLSVIGVSDLKAGLLVGSGRVSRTFLGVETDEEREGRLLMKMRGSMALLGVIPLLLSAFSCVHGAK